MNPPTHPSTHNHPACACPSAGVYVGCQHHLQHWCCGAGDSATVLQLWPHTRS